MLTVILGHVNKIANHFSWYKKLLPNPKLLGNNKYIELISLPLIDAKILDHQYYLQAKFKDGIVYKTSGTSSGIRKKIYYSTQDHAEYIIQRERIFRKHLKSNYSVACSDLGTGHAADSATEIFTNLGSKVVKTKDLMSRGGYLYLVHEDMSQIHNDYYRIREWEHNNQLFIVEDSFRTL